MQKIYDNSTQFSPILDNLREYRTDRHNIHRQVILYKFSHISGTEPCGSVFYRESHLLHLICTSNSSQDKLRSPPRTKFDMYKVISLLLFILYNTKEYRFSEIPRQPQFVNNVFINALPLHSTMGGRERNYRYSYWLIFSIATVFYSHLHKNSRDNWSQQDPNRKQLGFIRPNFGFSQSLKHQQGNSSDLTEIYGGAALWANANERTEFLNPQIVVANSHSGKVDRHVTA